jgi:hypothetical protein
VVARTENSGTRKPGNNNSGGNNSTNNAVDEDGGLSPFMEDSTESTDDSGGVQDSS